jgi:acetyltransferase-like isoleucine patch superfamily enzyme
LAAKKGGYSVARVFGKNYLLLLREQVQSGRLQESTYQLEKKRVLLEQILPYYFSPEHDFTRGRLSEYLVDYLEEDYFYVELEHRQYGALQTSYASLSGMTRLQRRWRLLNGHNGSQLAAFSGITPFEKVFVGNGTYGDLHIWEFGQPDERLQIGHYCSIAADVHFLLGGNDDYETVSTYPFRVKNFGEPMEASTKGPIVLSDDVWLGHRALILSGVRIGQGAIVAAGSVVTKNVEPYSIVAGNPARHVKFRFTKDVRDKLLLVDYSQLSADRLGALRGALQEPVNSVSVDQIVNALRGESIEHKDHSLNAHEGWGLK